MGTDGMDLKHYFLVAYYREACALVNRTRLELLRTYVSQYGTKARGPFEPSTIEHVNAELVGAEMAGGTQRLRGVAYKLGLLMARSRTLPQA